MEVSSFPFFLLQCCKAVRGWWLGASGFDNTRWLVLVEVPSDHLPRALLLSRGLRAAIQEESGEGIRFCSRENKPCVTAFFPRSNPPYLQSLESRTQIKLRDI